MVGLVASLALKTRLLKSKHTPLESCLCILIAFASYMLADGLALSGIVSILFCGMVLPAPPSPRSPCPTWRPPALLFCGMVLCAPVCLHNLPETGSDG